MSPWQKLDWSPGQERHLSPRRDVESSPDPESGRSWASELGSVFIPFLHHCPGLKVISWGTLWGQSPSLGLRVSVLHSLETPACASCQNTSPCSRC